MNQKTRQEQDSIGKIKVSNSNFWGAQTQRSLKNFKIGNNLMPIEIIHALVTIKMACAKVNQKQIDRQKKVAKRVEKFLKTGKGIRKRTLSGGLSEKVEKNKAILISRNIKKAQNILSNVCKGVFPGQYSDH